MHRHRSQGFEVRAFDRDPGQWTAWEGIPSAGMNGRGLSDQHDSATVKGYLNGRHVGNASVQRAIIGHGGTMEMRYGDITDYATVAKLVEGVDAIVHATAYFPTSSDDEMAWRVNCGGLWNVLDCARNSDGRVRRVVHIGSCHTKWPGSTPHPEPGSVFFDSSVRRPDASLYSSTKRLQEEMCRQFYDSDGLRIVVLRPDGIMDLRHDRQRDGAGASRKTAPLLEKPRVGSVCRYDIAAAAHAAVMLDQDGEADFEILHVATDDTSLPQAERASAFCNVGRTQQVLRCSFEHDLSRFDAEVDLPPAKM
jgi:nucleoside-diphosphate-sugar epimerase